MGETTSTTLNEFFNEYQYFYLIDGQGENNQYLLYKSPPTYVDFYEEIKIYNGMRAANAYFIKLYI